MKAISLWQPHATWIEIKWKTIETREHARFAGLVGQRIAIHASKKFDQGCGVFPSWKNAHTAMDIVNMMQWMKMCMGKIVCTAVVECMEGPLGVHLMSLFPQHREEWERRACCDIEGKHLYFLKDIEPLAKPVPFRGGQGIFNVPDELVKSPRSL